MTVRGAVCLNRARTVLMRGAPGNRRYLLKDRVINEVMIPKTEYDKVVSDYDNLSSQYKTVKGENEQLTALVKYYEEKFRLTQHKRFGASSEKTQLDDRQMYIEGFFNEVEVIADPSEEEPQIEEVVVRRRKRTKGQRQEDLSSLPIEVIEHTLPEDEQVCSKCNSQMHVMSTKVHKELEVIPARVKVIEHRYSVYGCRYCENNSDSVEIVTTPMPEPVIKGSIASPSMVAYIMTQKYIMHSPLYRLEQEFERQDVTIRRQTMANWVIYCALTWLAPIYDLMKSYLLSLEVIHADETTLQVLNEEGKEASSKSYMWMYRSSGDAEHPVVIYEYQKNRNHEHPRNFLKGWIGFCHADGYEAYHALENVTVVECWAHVRRYFDEALKSLSKDDRKNSKAAIGLDFCNKLFKYEDEFKKKGLGYEERYRQRLEKSKPVAEKFFEWAKSVNVLPKTALGKAITYAINQETYLMNFFLDGRLELSNNRAERSIKPFVMSRKNFLFSASEKGAASSAIVFSIIETAKENLLKPFEYLKYVFERMPNSTYSQISEYLPWSKSLPESCKRNLKKN